jgi:hypothetical protein
MRISDTHQASRSAARKVFQINALRGTFGKERWDFQYPSTSPNRIGSKRACVSGFIWPIHDRNKPLFYMDNIRYQVAPGRFLGRSLIATKSN